MRAARILLLAALLAGGVSCSRTVYTNLHPELPRPPLAAAAGQDRSSPRYWRHFFVYGWAPGELVIDAEADCGGTAYVDRIETQRSFAQGLVAAFAGYYINIYSPYTGRVVCTRHTAR